MNQPRGRSTQHPALLRRARSARPPTSGAALSPKGSAVTLPSLLAPSNPRCRVARAASDVHGQLGLVGEREDVATGDELREDRAVGDTVTGRAADDGDVRGMRVRVVVRVGMRVSVVVSRECLALAPVGDLGALPRGGQVQDDGPDVTADVE